MSVNQPPFHADRRCLAMAAVLLSLGALPLCSCGGGSTPARPPAISASAAGEVAIELRDANGDGTA